MSMNQNEFLEILEEAGVSTSYADILNAVVTALRHNANTMENAGIVFTAKLIKERADVIYNALDARGYYDDIFHAE